MRRCIVHFGMNKTGSSSIQSTLYNCSLSPEFHYIDIGVDNPTGPLLDAFMAPKRRHNSIKSRSRKVTIEQVKRRRSSVINKLRSQLETATAPNLILSAEGLWRLTYKELLNLYQFIQPYVDKMEAVAYIRPPKGFMESNFQQLVKGGGVKELDLTRFYPDYRERFEKFDDIFSTDNVQYWRFSPKHFPDNCVVRDFCSRLDIKAEIEVQRVNEGLSRNATAALFSYRKFSDRFSERDRFNRENELLVRKMYELPGTKLRFSSKLVEPILEERQEDISWMEYRLQAPLIEEITKYDDDAIQMEEDLLSSDHSTIVWLAEQAGTDYQDNGQPIPEQVAALMHKLRIKLASEDAKQLPTRTAKATTSINIKKLVRKAQKSYPKLQDQLSEKETVSLVRGVFNQIIQELDTVETGAVSVPGLGKFTIREIEKTIEGQVKPEKRIVFTP